VCKRYMCVPASGSTEQAVEKKLLVEVLNRFLHELPIEKRMMFLRRYWYMSSIKEIAEDYEISEGNVKNLLQISKLFRVSTDYLLNEEHANDDDLPKVKEYNKILQMNVTKIAIIGQAAFLNVAMRPFQEMQTVGMTKTEFMIKFIPLLVCSVWMACNLRYEKDAKQYKKNVKIELVYCMIQTVIFLFGYFSKLYWIATFLLLAVALFYILWVNPKYMNRPMTKK